MKKLDIFTKIFFAVSVTFNTLVISQVKAEDLRYQFNSQESASWENAQYEKITTNVRGERLIIRFFVDKNSNIYEFKRNPNYNYGPTKIGNLNSKSYSTGDTCYFGTNAACRSNITKTTEQYVIEDCRLIKYTRTDMIQFGTKGDINKYVLGSCTKGNNKAEKGDHNESYALTQKSRSLLLEGYNKEKKGDFNEAISYYTKAIEINPKYALAYYNRGQCKSILRDYEGAISDYTKAIEINPQYFKAYNNRGTSKAAILKDYEGAISDYTKAIEINPKNSITYKNRGVANYYIDRKDDACKDYKTAISLGLKENNFFNFCFQKQ